MNINEKINGYLLECFFLNHSVAGMTHNIEEIIRTDRERSWDILLLFIKNLPSDYLFLRFVREPFAMFLSLYGEEYLEKIKAETINNETFYRGILELIKNPSTVWGIQDTVLNQLSEIKTATNCIDNDDDNNEKIISSWITYESTFWAESLIEEMIEQRPDKAWDVILELVRNANNVEELAYIAAGVLENIIVCHGKDYIDLIESEALKSERFKLCLSGVWLNGIISDDIMHRIKMVTQNAKLSKSIKVLPDK